MLGHAVVTQSPASWMMSSAVPEAKTLMRTTEIIVATAVEVVNAIDLALNKPFLTDYSGLALESLHLSP